jgi:hypothetical protein
MLPLPRRQRRARPGHGSAPVRADQCPAAIQPRQHVVSSGGNFGEIFQRAQPHSAADSFQPDWLRRLSQQRSRFRHRPYNPNNFALCYKCHSSSVVDSSLITSWANHRTHLEDYRAACTTCHDSHASSQPNLVNFNTLYVQPYNGVLQYQSAGPNHGTCTLTCHDGRGRSISHHAVTY